MLFTNKELIQYGLTENEITVILDYQALLPVLQEENENWISAKLLHNQLKVGRDFSEWIKKQINDMELSENFDYKIETPSKGNQRKYGGDNRSIDYLLKVSTAKEIAMVAGSKGGRTSKKTKRYVKTRTQIFHRHRESIQESC